MKTINVKNVKDLVNKYDKVFKVIGVIVLSGAMFKLGRNYDRNLTIKGLTNICEMNPKIEEAFLEVIKELGIEC